MQSNDYNRDYREPKFTNSTSGNIRKVTSGASNHYSSEFSLGKKHLHSVTSIQSSSEQSHQISFRPPHVNIQKTSSSDLYHGSFSRENFVNSVGTPDFVCQKSEYNQYLNQSQNYMVELNSQQSSIAQIRSNGSNCRNGVHVRNVVYDYPVKNQMIRDKYQSVGRSYEGGYQRNAEVGQVIQTVTPPCQENYESLQEPTIFQGFKSNFAKKQ